MMPHPDLTELLARGAATSTGAHDLEEAWNRARIRLRSRRITLITGAIAVAAVALVAGIGWLSSGPTPPVIGEPTTADGMTDRPAGLPIDERNMSSPARTRVDATVDGAPPFNVTVGSVGTDDEDSWANHTLTITSEWRSAIAVRATGVTVRLTEPGMVGQHPEETTVVNGSAVRVLGPGESTTIMIWVAPDRIPPDPGQYHVTIQLPFWRDANADDPVPPSGTPDGTAIVRLTYDLLTTSQLEARAEFCAQAPGALEAATRNWIEDPDAGIEALIDALAVIRTAADSLPDEHRSLLLDEIAGLADPLERLRSGEQVGHGQVGGFDTGGVAVIVNELCDTRIPSTGIQS